MIPAAGLGTRLADPADGESQIPKALRVLGDKPLLRWAAEAVAAACDELVVSAPANLLDDVAEVLAGLPIPHRAVTGGATRQESVRAGLAVLDEDTTWVLVHDAARPLVPSGVVDRVVDALEAGACAVVPAVAIPDSLRLVTGSDDSEVVDRTRIRGVQTPQGFCLDVLRRAHGETDADAGATDDASLVERLGVKIALVDGSDLAFKVTTPLDLVLAQALVRGRAGQQ